MANSVCAPTRTARDVHRLVIALIALGSVAAAASAQTTVTLSVPGTQITADLTIQGGASGLVDFSTSPVLASKVSSESYTRRILLKIDTQNTIPANAVIQSATLSLVLKGADSSDNRPLTAYNVTQSFASGETTWYHFRSGQAWSNAGGDVGGSFGTTYVSSAVGSTYTFDLTPLVQRAVNGEFGSRYTRVALLDTGGASSGSYREFHSTRATDTSVRPRLVITYGGSAPPPPPPPTGTTLRVMQFNIHKTKDSTGACNPDFTANTIVAQNADVVSLNEVNFYAGTCGWNVDMGAQLQSLVQQKTGVTWYLQHVNPNGVGNVLLSRYPPVSSSAYLLDNGRGVAQMGLVVNGRTVNVFSTHIEYDNASWRPTQIAETLSWITNFSAPRILMGDMNTWPATPDYYTFTNALRDGWVTAQTAGTATAYNGTGATEGLSRIDYVFYSPVAALTLDSVDVPDTLVNGLKPSDHDAVIAVFTVK
jgi:endonuclease/exonuclease/phosphatase family metal-dependent hydrolase